MNEIMDVRTLSPSIHPSLLPSFYANQSTPSLFCVHKNGSPMPCHEMQLQSPPTCESRPLLWKGKNSVAIGPQRWVILSGFGITLGPLFAWLHGNHRYNNRRRVFFLHFAHSLRGEILDLGVLLIGNMWSLARKFSPLSIKFLVFGCYWGASPYGQQGWKGTTSPLITLHGM